MDIISCMYDRLFKLLCPFPPNEGACRRGNGVTHWCVFLMVLDTIGALWQWHMIRLWLWHTQNKHLCIQILIWVSETDKRCCHELNFTGTYILLQFIVQFPVGLCDLHENLTWKDTCFFVFQSSLKRTRTLFWWFDPVGSYRERGQEAV